jgi:hypothetical protein
VAQSERLAARLGEEGRGVLLRGLGVRSEDSEGVLKGMVRV